jgi:hypothetical protein
MARTICIVCGVLAFLSNEAAADLIAYWNFNSYSGWAGPISATSGAGTLSINGFPADDLLALPGSTVNALGGDPAGNALGLENNANNGDSLTLSFSMAGHSSLVLSYATRRTSTGFNANQWSYSTDGASFTPFGSLVNPTTTTTFDLITRDFSSVTSLNNDSPVFLRYVLAGATGASGNNRIDNIQLNADKVTTQSAVPEPGSLALMGLGTLGLACIRRHRSSLLATWMCGNAIRSAPLCDRLLRCNGPSAGKYGSCPVAQ